VVQFHSHGHFLVIFHPQYVFPYRKLKKTRQVMELMSSSDDEGDSPTSPARSKPSQSQDSLEDELLSPSARLTVQDKPRHRSAGKKPRPPPPQGQKRVISARELLLNFLPSAKHKKPAKEPRDSALDAAVAAYDLVTPKKKPPPPAKDEEKPEKELTASERIARKYGLVAASRASPKESTLERGSSGSVGSESIATGRTASTDDHSTLREESALSVQTPVAKSKKRTFWDAQTVGVDAERQVAAKSAYVSPFSNPDGFTNMKRRRQRRQQPVEQMSEEEMKSARDAFYDDSKSDAQHVGPRPRHIIGSAIPDVDDADEWMSDSKEMASDSEQPAAKATAEVEVRLAPTGSRATGSGSRQKRAPSKRQTRRRARTAQSDSSEEEKEAYTSERWPQLDPPKVRYVLRAACVASQRV
jgi:hypothetical protein